MSGGGVACLRGRFFVRAVRVDQAEHDVVPEDNPVVGSSDVELDGSSAAGYAGHAGHAGVCVSLDRVEHDSGCASALDENGLRTAAAANHDNSERTDQPVGHVKDEKSDNRCEQPFRQPDHRATPTRLRCDPSAVRT